LILRELQAESLVAAPSEMLGWARAAEARKNFTDYFSESWLPSVKSVFYLKKN
jgi:hypothetical protein